MVAWLDGQVGCGKCATWSSGWSSWMVKLDGQVGKCAGSCIAVWGERPCIRSCPEAPDLLICPWLRCLSLEHFAQRGNTP